MMEDVCLAKVPFSAARIAKIHGQGADSAHMQWLSSQLWCGGKVGEIKVSTDMEPVSWVSLSCRCRHGLNLAPRMVQAEDWLGLVPLHNLIHNQMATIALR